MISKFGLSILKKEAERANHYIDAIESKPPRQIKE